VPVPSVSHRDPEAGGGRQLNLDLGAGTRREVELAELLAVPALGGHEPIAAFGEGVGRELSRGTRLGRSRRIVLAAAQKPERRRDSGEGCPACGINDRSVNSGAGDIDVPLSALGHEVLRLERGVLRSGAGLGQVLILHDETALGAAAAAPPL
jgi:hypothetical protein